MTTPRNKHLLFNWIFLGGVALLALNDHYLKAACPNALTGKLSDISGLLIFPMFLAFIFPRYGKHMPLITGLLFIYWKSPWSTPLIGFCNRFSPLPIDRTIDYTDLLTLAVLPLSYHLIRNIDRYRITGTLQPRLSPLWLILPCSFVFMSTSMKYVDAHHPDGSIYVGERYTLKMPKDQVLEAMRKEGLHPIQDTSNRDAYPQDHFIIENVQFPGTRDSIQSIQFGLYDRGDKSDILVTYVKSKGDLRISDWQIMRMYTRYYRHLIKSRIVKPMK